MSHGSMLESCEEDISDILGQTKFSRISVKTPLPNPEHVTLKSFVKWTKTRMEEDEIDEPVANAFFEIMKRVESCVKEDGSGLLEEDKGAAEEDSKIDDGQDAPKSAMRAGAKKKGLDKALTLDIKKKDKTKISEKELKENKVGAEFYKICKQLSDDIPEVSPTPCYYCMIGVCNKNDHILTEINQIHIYILLAILRNKIDDKASVKADRPITTGDYTLEKVIAKVYGTENTGEGDRSSTKTGRDLKQTGEKFETVEAIKANGSKYRLPVFALQRVAKNMVGACLPWINHINEELEPCDHCNGMHPVGFKINNNASCPCGSFNSKTKLFYKHCQGGDGKNCLTYLALKHPEGQKTFLDEGVSRGDLEVILADHDFRLTNEAKNHNPTKVTLKAAGQQNLTPGQRRANRMASSDRESDSISTNSSTGRGVRSEGSTQSTSSSTGRGAHSGGSNQSWRSTSTYGRYSFQGGRGGRGGSRFASNRGAPGIAWSDTVRSEQSSNQSDNHSQLSDSSQYDVTDEAAMLINRIGRHERENNREAFEADSKRLREIMPHIIGGPLDSHTN